MPVSYLESYLEKLQTIKEEIKTITKLEGGKIDISGIPTALIQNEDAVLNSYTTKWNTENALKKEKINKQEADTLKGVIPTLQERIDAQEKQSKGLQPYYFKTEYSKEELQTEDGKEQTPDDTVSQAVQSLSSCTENTDYYNKKAELLMQTAQITYDSKKKEGKFQLTGEDAIKLFNADINPSSSFSPLLSKEDKEAIQLAMEAYERIKEEEEKQTVKPTEVKEEIGEENWKRLGEAVNEAVNEAVAIMKGIEEGRWDVKEYEDTVKDVPKYNATYEFIALSEFTKSNEDKLNPIVQQRNTNPIDLIEIMRDPSKLQSDEQLKELLEQDRELKEAVEKLNSDIKAEKDPNAVNSNMQDMAREYIAHPENSDNKENYENYLNRIKLGAQLFDAMPQ